MQTIFGPVPSRRLGRSLGVDVIPSKTCSYDCVYCESGHTTHLTTRREVFVMPDVVLEELAGYFAKYPQGADAITLSSAGEPTLYEPLGELLGAIKKRYSSLPLVVLTNGSLLWDDEIRKALALADRVVPSLDAVTDEVFARVNAPHPHLELSAIVEGLRSFRMDYRGQFHLEVLLVSGYNDHPQHLNQLREVISRLNPDQVELNTVVRPPANANVKGLSEQELSTVLPFFPVDKTAIVGCYRGSAASSQDLNLAARMVEVARRRPCTIPEMAASLGVAPDELTDTLSALEQNYTLTRCFFNGLEYICCPSSKKPDRMKSDHHRPAK